MGFEGPFLFASCESPLEVGSEDVDQDLNDVGILVLLTVVGGSVLFREGVCQIMVLTKRLLLSFLHAFVECLHYVLIVFGGLRILFEYRDELWRDDHVQNLDHCSLPSFVLSLSLQLLVGFSNPSCVLFDLFQLDEEARILEPLSVEVDIVVKAVNPIVSSRV